MISREKCLEWAKDAGSEPSYYGFDATEGRSFYTITSLEALINRAYAEGLADADTGAGTAYLVNKAYKNGQKDMRERAAKEVSKRLKVSDCVLSDGVRALEIE